MVLLASWCIEVCPFVILRDFVPPASLPFPSPSDGLFSFSLFSFPGFFLSNVEENGFFCIVVLNIVFLFMRQLDCKLHATIDWKKKKAVPKSPFCFFNTQTHSTHIHITATNACECIFLLAGFTCDVLVLLQVQFVSSCMKDCGEGGGSKRRAVSFFRNNTLPSVNTRYHIYPFVIKLWY